MEFACGASALLLLLLGSITLSGYQEVQRRASIAARQVAYQSAWGLEGVPDVEYPRRIYQQNFADAGLQDAVGISRYITERDLRSSLRRSLAPGLAGDAATTLLATLDVSATLTGKRMDLDAGGYLSGEIVAAVVPHSWTPDPFRGLDITLRQPYALLADPWSSGSARQVQERTSSLVPTQRLASFAAVWQELAVPLSILEPSIGNLCLGLIEPEAVPEDRLGPPIRGTPARRICQ